MSSILLQLYGAKPVSGTCDICKLPFVDLSILVFCLFGLVLGPYTVVLITFVALYSGIPQGGTPGTIWNVRDIAQVGICPF